MIGARALASWVVLGVLLASSPVLAQRRARAAVETPPPPDPTDDEARRLFSEGTRAVHEGRMRDAERDLSRSYELVRRPATAFNLVVALRGLGSLVRAMEICTTYLETPEAALDADRAAEVDAICTEARAGVAELHVRAAGTAPFDVRVDDAPLGRLRPMDERTVPLDPGDHRIVAIDGDLRSEQEVSLPAGARLSIELTAPVASTLDVPLVVGLSVGGAVLVVGAIIAVAVATSSSGPTYDYPVTATLMRF